MIKERAGLKRRIFLIIAFLYFFLPVHGQNCSVDFPGAVSRTFSGACGGSTVANLELGKNISMGNGDTFTFNVPVVNITGNLHVDAEGSGKIIIPAGVTVNLGGNFQLHSKNSGCSAASPCVFEIVVNGHANFTDDLDNDLFKLIWSGTGTVVVGDDFKNSSNACMDCGSGGCPNIQVDASECDDDGSGCGGDFCTKINTCSSDTVKPIITNRPSDQVVPMTGPGCTQFVSWSSPVADDNCALLSFSQNHYPGPFPKGTTVVTYTATDVAGNIETCTFNVTVVDNELPVIAGPLLNISRPADASCKAEVSWPAPSATDNCGFTKLTCTPPSGSLFSIGTTPVTYTATDSSGRTATRTFNVTVTDNLGPIITGCKDIVVNAGSSCNAKVSWVEPLATDCGSVISMISSHQPGQTFTLGKTKVTYTATDNKGNTSSCEFNVIVEDKTAPLFQNTFAEVIATVEGTCTAVVSWQPPTASDNCELKSVDNSHSPGDTFPIGKTVVKYTATDKSGNIAVCQFDVVVNNKTLPVISACSDDILMEGDENGMATVSWISPTATAECGEALLSASHQPGVFNIGTTKVEYKATDSGGNTSYCSFNVIVSQVKIEVDVSKVVTPDGNGMNDDLILTNIEKFQDNEIVIVDRWGGIIFEGSGYNNENVVWRGTNRSGDPVPTGTYFYTVLVRFGSAEIQKSGFIELIR